jgi:hypothetical protein
MDMFQIDVVVHNEIDRIPKFFCILLNLILVVYKTRVIFTDTKQL